MNKRNYLFFGLFLSILLLNLASINSKNNIYLKHKSVNDPSSISSSGVSIIAWGNNGTVVASKQLSQYGYPVCSDRSGGAIMAWVDERNGAGNEEIYVQRINAIGQKLWGDNGTLICNATGSRGGQTSDPEIAICSDENGGAIITWRDNRADANGDIYAQRINSTGGLEWTINGTVIGNHINEEDQYPQICSDGKGGAIITWAYYVSSGTWDILAQYINSTGNIKWTTNGTNICNEKAGWQQHPQICSDNKGGAIIVWDDYRSTNNLDVYAQRINATGHNQWGENGDLNGTIICNHLGDQGAVGVVSPVQIDICSDENEGAIITWYDERNDGDGDIYAQRINSLGLIQWGESGDLNGTLICNKYIFMDAQHDPKICSDSNGGAIITWVDHRDEGGPENRGKDIYAQRVNSLGQTQWTANGTAVCNKQNGQQNPQICSGGQGGAIIVWDDGRDDSAGDIYAQLLSSSGNPQWTKNGSVISNAVGTSTNEQYIPKICSDGYGGAFLGWWDKRYDSSGDIYAQKIVYSTIKIPGIANDDDDDDEGAPIVPYGNSYLIFLTIGIISLSIFIKHKIKVKK